MSNTSCSDHFRESAKMVVLGSISAFSRIFTAGRVKPLPRRGFLSTSLWAKPLSGNLRKARVVWRIRVKYLFSGNGNRRHKDKRGFNE